MPNYSYVADAHYKPYSFQEMLMPLTLYKQESDKREQEYLDYADRMDVFRQMAEDNPDSYAAQIYNNYSNDYQKAYNDYIEHGLNIGNKNDWLNLKRRYKGEIGRLEEADKVLKELQKNMRDKGSSYIWGNEAPSLDDILHNPNYVNYGIDSNELYKKGVEAAASASSKLYGNTRFQDVTKYYQEAIQTQGYDPKLIASFRNDLKDIPELRDALNDILVETGADKGLSGYNLDRAVQTIINGMVNGASASYKENRSIKENPGVLTAAQADNSARSWRQLYLSETNNEQTWDKNSKSYIDKNEWIYTHDAEGNRTGYTPEYMLSKGYVKDENNEWKKITGNTGSSSGNASNSNTEKWKPTESKILHRNGTLANPKKISATSGAEEQLGTPIDFYKAAEINETLWDLPEYVNHYLDFDYYYNNATGSIRIDPKPDLGYSRTAKAAQKGGNGKQSGVKEENPKGEGENPEGEHNDI